MTCKFPNCKMTAQPNGYCIGHREFSSFTAGKRKEPVNKKSDKRRELEKEYKKIVQDMMAQSRFCQIKSPVCTNIAEGLHHMAGRVGDNYLERSLLKRACNACNRYCEEHPVWAKKNGHSVSRLKKHTA